MKKKERITEYLTLSRKERNGVMLIGIVIISLFFLPSILPTHGRKTNPPADTAWIVAMKKLEQNDARAEPGDRPFREKADGGRKATGNSGAGGPKEAVLFPFDPNTLDASRWQQLGLREKTIKTILNYVTKGGKFRKPEDLQRIYGLFPDEYERLRPFIRIEAERKAQTPAWTNESTFTEKPAAAPGPAKYTTVEINSADTVAFIALPGIGSKLALRIIHFREKLGGFYSINQVAETFGLADSVFRRIQPYLRLEVMTLRKININTATAEELKVHPYLKWNVINALLAYRKEHGAFRKKEDLKQVMAVTDEIYQRIAPYLVTE